MRTLGEVLSLRFNRIQFTPDLMPADIVGTTIVSEDLDGRRALRFQAGPVFANIVLADEINRATPKTQSALLEAMQEHTVSAGEATRPLPRPFFVLATQNPIEMEGTYPLPEAQLDRFLFKVLVPFPRHNELEEILQRTIRPAAPEAAPQPVADAEDVLRMLRVAREVVVAPHLATYAVRLVLATHPNESAAPPAISTVRPPRREPARTAGDRRRRPGPGAARRPLQRLARRPASRGAARAAASPDPGLRSPGRRRHARAAGQRRAGRRSRSRGHEP